MTLLFDQESIYNHVVKTCQHYDCSPSVTDAILQDFQHDLQSGKRLDSQDIITHVIRTVLHNKNQQATAEYEQHTRQAPAQQHWVTCSFDQIKVTDYKVSAMSAHGVIVGKPTEVTAERIVIDHHYVISAFDQHTLQRIPAPLPELEAEKYSIIKDVVAPGYHLPRRHIASSDGQRYRVTAWGKTYATLQPSDIDRWEPVTAC